MNYKQQKQILIIVFLVLPLALLIVFSYYPAVKLFQLSFTDWDGYSKSYNYVGFNNYIDVFGDSDSLKVFVNTLAHLIMGLIQIILALYLAVILNGRLRCRNFFRGVIILPFILNSVAVAFIFNYLYDYERSPVNAFIRSIGAGDHAIKWLSESYASNFSLAFIGLWMYSGLVMVIFLGALQSIPFEMYESAEIDGANFFHKLWYITIPNIRTVMILQVFLATNGSLQAFFQPFIITQGGPGIRTETFVSYTMKIAFNFSNFGKSSAMGVLLMFFVLALVYIQRKALSEKEDRL